MDSKNIKHTPNEFGFQDKLSEEFPRLILVCIAQPCNARCPHCFLTVMEEQYREGFSQKNAGRYLTLEQWRALVDECEEYKDHTHLHVSSYGETMLHKNFIELLEYASAKGVPTSIITNGSLLTEEKSKRIVELGIKSVEISLEAHKEELYDKIKVGLDFQIIKQNTEKLVRIRNELNGNTVVMIGIINQPKANPEIEEAKAYWGKIVDHVMVRKFVTWGLDDLKARGESTDPYLASKDPCPYPFERLMIDPAGYIRLCPYDNKPPKNPQRIIKIGKREAFMHEFGRLGVDSIKSVWRGVRHNKIKECHINGKFDHAKAKVDAPLCHQCEDRVMRSWTHNMKEGVLKKIKPKKEQNI